MEIVLFSWLIVPLYFIVRCIICFVVNKRMCAIAVKELGSSEWYTLWDVKDWIYWHPFTFRINRYIKKVRRYEN
jgi:hypothetical protein